MKSLVDSTVLGCPPPLPHYSSCFPHSGLERYMFPSWSQCIWANTINWQGYARFWAVSIISSFFSLSLLNLSLLIWSSWMAHLFSAVGSCRIAPGWFIKNEICSNPSSHLFSAATYTPLPFRWLHLSEMLFICGSTQTLPLSILSHLYSLPFPNAQLNIL